jgi:hypothetical protein
LVRVADNNATIVAYSALCCGGYIAPTDDLSAGAESTALN